MGILGESPNMNYSNNIDMLSLSNEVIGLIMVELELVFVLFTINDKIFEISKIPNQSAHLNTIYSKIHPL